jgi:hypothetical protein
MFLHLASRFAPGRKSVDAGALRGARCSPKRCGLWGSLIRETMMPNVEYALASDHSLRYLDIAPMIAALRFQPSDFEYAHGWLNHVPSRHRFQFDRKGRVIIDALCGCAALSVRPEQADELHSMFKTWRQDYWQPLETNREFASHFAEPNGWVRLFRDVRMAWRRFRRRADAVRIPAEAISATPAE